MSLLIKALEQAAESKNAGDKFELSLEPVITSDATLQDANAKPKLSTLPSDSQQAASTVFSAKTKPHSKPANNLALFAFATLILLIAAIGYFYWYWQSLSAPELIVARPLVVQPLSQVAEAKNTDQVSANLNTQSATAETSGSGSPEQMQTKIESSMGESKVGALLQSEHTPALEAVSPAAKQKKQNPITVKPLTENNERMLALAASNSKPLVFGEPIALSDDDKLDGSASRKVKVIQNQPTASINPKLIEAYHAYNKGDDAQAQQAYREVLKGDVRNTDALLGMATIAARQGRDDDALGWYRKVLEVEPRNQLAQAGMVALQQEDDPVSAETRLKNLITQHPDSASLHASLGDLYASQNQWASAQQAYFQAYHFESNNAQHVFNLAVSLDRMSKPNLALPYYKRALELVTAGGATNIDRMKLESRISQLTQ